MPCFRRFAESFRESHSKAIPYISRRVYRIPRQRGGILQLALELPAIRFPCKSSTVRYNCMVIDRIAQPRVRELLTGFPAVALLGPRQAGKTTLARDLAEAMSGRAVYLDLELPSDRAKMSDAELYLSAHEDHLVILDEIQRAPGLFQVLRGVIDQRRRKGIRAGEFLLLGSASMDLLQQSAESLAGRIAYLELTPFILPEVQGMGPGAADRLWVRGGFPDSYLAADDSSSFRWRIAFIQTYLERDIPALGPRVPAETLHRFWRMLAHNQGQLLNAARLAAGLGVSGQTVARYLDILVDLLLVRRLQPWTANLAKRLVRSPKVFVRDSGIVHALLGLTDQEELLGHPVVGASWEANMDLRDEIQRIAVEWPCYGWRRVHAELWRRGWVGNHKPVRRIMREDNLLCIRRRKFVVATTDSKHDRPVYPNLAKGMKLTGINQLWIADITYIRLETEFIYLAVVLDAYSRRVIGWALGRTLEDDLTIAALGMGVLRRPPGPGLVHHSDRGVQYASYAYTEILKQHQIRISMSRKGNPYDNAACESFMKTLK